jgi:hypothetical protein
MGEGSESAGKELCPTAHVKVVEKAAEVQRQRAALPSQEYGCKQRQGTEDPSLVAARSRGDAWVGGLLGSDKWWDQGGRFKPQAPEE